MKTLSSPLAATATEETGAAAVAAATATEETAVAAAAADPAPAIGKKLRVSAAFSYSKERDEAIVKARSGFVLRKINSCIPAVSVEHNKQAD